jgi:NAD(P)H-hydrate repair Nnr-like enzyme with NAD(P)H-hydrate dehydratase domain
VCHAGAGLVTLYVSPEVQPLVAARVTPEVMVRATRNYLEVIEGHYDALAIGPGLGAERRDEILSVIERVPHPLVIDADALNGLAGHRGTARLVRRTPRAHAASRRDGPP